MAEDDDKYVLIESPLSGEFKRDGITVDVLIYRGDADTTWTLEIVDDAANSYVWDEQFASDQAAMEEFLASVESEGMKQYNPYYRRDLQQCRTPYRAPFKPR